MKRAIIITKGRVPRVGYRDLVADWAMDLGIVGFIENQPDGTVKIVAEGEEEILEDFVRKAQPEDDPLIRIARVDVGYEKAEKQDVMIEKQDQMLGKQDQMLTKQVETIAVIKSGVDELREFRTETQQNFTNLDTKYGKIAAILESHRGN
jgi:acylphosphatase